MANSAKPKAKPPMAKHKRLRMVLLDFFALRASGASLAASTAFAAIAFSIASLAVRAVFSLPFPTYPLLSACLACSMCLFKVLPNSILHFATVPPLNEPRLNWCPELLNHTCCTHSRTSHSQKAAYPNTQPFIASQRSQCSKPHRSAPCIFRIGIINHPAPSRTGARKTWQEFYRLNTGNPKIQQVSGEGWMKRRNLGQKKAAPSQSPKKQNRPTDFRQPVTFKWCGRKDLNLHGVAPTGT